MLAIAKRNNSQAWLIPKINFYKTGINILQEGQIPLPDIFTLEPKP